MLKRIFNLLFCGILLFSIIGCTFNTNKLISEEIETQLENKYEKEFTVYALGGRNAYQKEITAYVYSNEDPTMLFTVRITGDNIIVYNNYEYRLVLRKIENIVNSTSAKYGVETVCYVNSSTYDDNIGTNITPDEYIKNYTPESFRIAHVIRDSNKVTASNLEKIYKEIQGELGNRKLGIGVYVLSSRDYDAVSDEVVRETQFFDKYRLSRNGTKDEINEFKLQVSNNSLSMSLQEIDDLLRNN